MDDFKRTSWHKAQQPANGSPAFTLTELAVVIATLAVLFVLLLPALANTKFRDRYASCTSNLRQWGVVCNRYATDNTRTPAINLPSFDIGGSPGGNLWDLSTNMVNGLQPYGVTVQMWFCPVKPNEFLNIENANPGVQITDARQFISLNNPPTGQGIQYNHTYLTIFYSVYIPRKYNGSQWCPMDRQASKAQYGGWFTRGGSANPALLGWPTPWPMTASSKWAGKNPILTDRLYGPGGQHNPALIFSSSGHPYGSSVANLNLLYADGHVVSHNQNAFQWTYDVGSPQFCNFY